MGDQNIFSTVVHYHGRVYGRLGEGRFSITRPEHALSLPENARTTWLQLPQPWFGEFKQVIHKGLQNQQAERRLTDLED